MFENYNNTAQPSSEGSVSSAVIRISVVVAVALSALYLTLSDAPVTKHGQLAQRTGASAVSEHDAESIDAFIHPEPLGIDQAVVNAQNLPAQPKPSPLAIAEYSVNQ